MNFSIPISGLAHPVEVYSYRIPGSPPCIVIGINISGQCAWRATIADPDLGSCPADKAITNGSSMSFATSAVSNNQKERD